MDANAALQFRQAPCTRLTCSSASSRRLAVSAAPVLAADSASSSDAPSAASCASRASLARSAAASASRSPAASSRDPALAPRPARGTWRALVPLPETFRGTRRSPALSPPRAALRPAASRLPVAAPRRRAAARKAPGRPRQRPPTCAGAHPEGFLQRPQTPVDRLPSPRLSRWAEPRPLLTACEHRHGQRDGHNHVWC